MLSEFPLFATCLARLCEGALRLLHLSRWVSLTSLVIASGLMSFGPLVPGIAQAQQVCASGSAVNTRYIIFSVASVSCLNSDTQPTNEIFYLRVTPGASVAGPSADASVFEFEVRDVDGASADTPVANTNAPLPTGYGGSMGIGDNGTARYFGNTITAGTMTIQVNAKGNTYTITISDLAWTDGANTATFTNITISGGVFDPAPPTPPSSPSDPASPSSPESRAVLQQTASSAVFSNQSGRLFSAGVTGAIAQRFRGGTGADFSLNQTGSFGSAFVSTQGATDWLQERSTQRLREDDVVSIYDPLLPSRPAHPTSAEASSAQDAIATLYGEVHDNAPEELSDPALGYAPHGLTVDPIEDAQAPWNIWARGSFTHFNGDAFDGDAWAGVVGVDYLLTDRLLIGVMGGYEAGDFTFPIEAGAFQGDGLSFGAYTGIQLSEFLIAEAYVAHSLLDYENRTATGVGTTEARRTLASFNLVGSHALTERITLEPNARISYAHERQKGYVMSDGTAVATEVIDSGTLSIGSRISYLLPFEAYGQFRVFASGHTEYMFSSQDETGSTLPDFDDLTSGRFGLGIDALFLNGWQLTLDGNVGGIGSQSYLSYTGNGRLRIPLN